MALTKERKVFFSLHSNPTSLYRNEVECMSDKRVLLSVDSTSEGGKFFLEPFNNHMEAATFINNLLDENITPNLYEVIPFQRKIKFFMDIDIKDNDVENLEKLTHNYMSTLMNIIHDSWKEMTGRLLEPEKDIILCSSHGEKKRSFHIIFPRLICDTISQAKEVVKFIKGKLPAHYQAGTYLDDSVYKRNQSFRTLFSTKKGQFRPKYALPSWEFGKVKVVEYTPLKSRNVNFILDNYKFLFIRALILDSFVSHLNRGGSYQLRPSFVEQFRQKLEEKEKKRFNSEFIEMPKEIPDLPEGFKIDRIDNERGKVRLKRISPSLCIHPFCNRVHEHDNAFFRFKDFTWYFQCYRAKADDFEEIPISVVQIKV